MGERVEWIESRGAECQSPPVNAAYRAHAKRAHESALTFWKRHESAATQDITPTEPNP